MVNGRCHPTADDDRDVLKGTNLFNIAVNSGESGTACRLDHHAVVKYERLACFYGLFVANDDIPDRVPGSPVESLLSHLARTQ